MSAAPVKDYYQLLGLEPSASADEIKKAFRQQIAKYHPDKVQHLGKEFQDMAAERAAELTEAYRILSVSKRRAEYDHLRTTIGVAEPEPSAPHAAAPETRAPEPTTEPEAPEPAEGPAAPTQPETGGQTFTEERGRRDEFVRRASVGRVHSAIDRVVGEFEEPTVRGFDLAIIPKPKLFARADGPRLLVRFVARVDSDAIADAWKEAAKWAIGHEVCVLLMGSAVAPAGELATAIGEQRRMPARTAKVTLVPVDVRDWHAHIPSDTPKLARTLLEGLQKQQ